MRHARGIRRIAATIGNAFSAASQATEMTTASRGTPPHLPPPDGVSAPIQEVEGIESADVVVRMLGPFELAIRDVEVEQWVSYKGLAVLKYLLMSAPRPVRRESLMDLFWPGYRPQSARNNLNVAIYALRRSLEAAADHVSLILYRDGATS